MFLDYVIPNGNEQEYAKMALQLGIKEICFLYSTEPKKPFAHPEIKVHIGVSASRGNKQIGSLIAVRATKNQKLFDSSPDVVYGFETLYSKDKTYSRSAGLNISLLQKASKKKSAIAFSVEDLLLAKNQEQYLGRLRLNFTLARKYKVVIFAASFASSPYFMRSESDINSLLRAIGIESLAAKKAVSAGHKLLCNKFAKKSPGFVADGIELVG